jgi:CubicO group peptidase (beta-lactamase class C family)
MGLVLDMGLMLALSAVVCAVLPRRFGAMLLNGGELDGVRILKPQSVDLMWRNSLPDSNLPISMNGWTSDEHTGA